MTSGMKYLAPLLICAATLAVAALAGPPAAATDAVAAVFPPWWDRERSMHAAAQADALVLREGAVASILVVRSDTPSLGDRLRDSGALLVLSLAGLSGCWSQS